MAWAASQLLLKDVAPGGYEGISVATTAVGFTAGSIKPTTGTYIGMEAKGAVISVETGNIRFRVDGTDPTAAEGHAVAADDALVLLGAQAIKNFRAICKTGSASAVLKVTYYF